MDLRRALTLGLALSLAWVGMAIAEERENSFEISEFLSFVDFAKETSLDDNPGVGIRIGHNFNTWLGGEITYQRVQNARFREFSYSSFGQYKTVKLDGPLVDWQEFEATAVLNWKRWGTKTLTRLQPYLVFGFGYEDFSPSAGLSEQQAWILSKKEGRKRPVYQPAAAKIDSSPTQISGIGARYYFNEGLALRLDLRFVTATAADFSNFVPNLGLSWVFGGGPPGKDSDGDGVVDYQDDCPDTPKGAIVNSRGCPSDADGDGVFDGVDECPDTPKGVVVDAKGCPVDSDGDGVPDGIDQCKETPKGAKVDDKGCPIDSDGDGVPDGIDECPDTPAGAKVDAKGCPVDSDGDGVPDGIDECAKTPKGVKVDAKGCPLDSDGDGVPDGTDECPDTPAGMKVDKKGCPPVKPLFLKEQKELVLKGVNFDTDKATLKPESMLVLDEVAASLAAYTSVKVEIQGHTDSTGSETHNQNLSDRRAAAVRDYLMSKGIAPDRLTAVGYGESRPVAANDTVGGRAENRRVELHRLD